MIFIKGIKFWTNNDHLVNIYDHINCIDSAYD